MPSRRSFLKTAGAGLGAAALSGTDARPLDGTPFIRRGAVTPVAVASSNGLEAVNRAVRRVMDGGDTLDAVVEGVNIVELDPEDITVGYGGLPNEDGVVQLDASVMHGPSRGAGAVAALEGVKTPSRVAVAVMRHTDHVLLVGEGAREFARKLGFEVDQELLTDASRRRWLEWRTGLSEDDDWIPPPGGGDRDDDGAEAMLESHDGVRPHGTINCNVVDAAGDSSGVTTTSGLAWKISGRVGDSPLVGAGLYVDNDVGACGSTGRGEAVIKSCGSHTVVEYMRQGLSPTDACIETLRRIVRWTVEDRLLAADGRPNYNVSLYAVNKNGEFGAARIYPGQYAVNVGGAGEIRDTAVLWEDRPE